MTEAVAQLAKRKDQLWAFMQKVKNLPAVLDQMQVSGTRDQMREFEALVKTIREME